MAHVADLARHFTASIELGDAAKALVYARRAAERAKTMLAWEEAIGHYERALMAAEHAGPPDPRQRCELLLGLGDACTGAGDATRARSEFERAAVIARHEGWKRQLAQAALGAAGRSVWEAAFVDPGLVRLLEEALAALGPGDGALRARVLSRLAQALLYADARDRREKLTSEALRIASVLEDHAALTAALEARNVALSGPEWLEDRLAIADQLIALSERGNDADAAMRGRVLRIAALFELGNGRELEAEIDRHAAAADDARDPLQRWQSALFTTARAGLEGRFEDAERTLADAGPLGSRVDPGADLRAAAQLAALRWLQGRLAELLPLARRFTERGDTWGLRANLALFALESGDEKDARRQLRLAEAGMTGGAHEAGKLLALGVAAEVATRLGEPTLAKKLYALLLPHAALNAVGQQAFGGPVGRYLGLAATLLGQLDKAELHFEQALALAGGMSARPWVAMTQGDYAAMLRARGAGTDRGRAARLAAETLATADGLGMAGLVERVRPLAVEAVPD